jgi:hypothetical protein
MLVDNIPVHDCFPFEQHQALSLPLALLQDLMEDGPIRAALIGMGAPSPRHLRTSSFPDFPCEVSSPYRAMGHGTR